MSNIIYKIARTKKDFECLKNMIKKIFDQEVYELADDLFYRSPKKEDNIYFCAYDNEAEKYVGILCLLDTPVKYGDVILKTAEYGIAGTLAEYRGQKINNKLTEMFFEKCKELNYNLAVIEGIPYFYRRYGFNYAVEMTNEKIDLFDLDLNNNNNLKLRKAESKDIDFLIKSYKNTVDSYDLCKIKDRKIIKAQLNNYLSDPVKKDYYIIENLENKIGYLTMDIGDEIHISDISNNLTFDQYESLIKYFKDEGHKKITTDLKENNKFVKYLKSIGSTGGRWYSYQLKIIDEFKLLNKIKPILEKRIKNTIYSNEELTLNYDNYKEMIQIKINNGKINLQKLNRDELDSDLAFTPQGAVKLFFDEKQIEEITDFLPDCYVKDKYKDIVKELFTNMKGHFYVNY